MAGTGWSMKTKTVGDEGGRAPATWFFVDFCGAVGKNSNRSAHDGKPYEGVEQGSAMICRHSL